jgi:endonuclease/exonuclease/phosphatase family metal-dependent hydrolase
LLLVLSVALLAAALPMCCGPAPRPSGNALVADHYLFCFWNAENLFDDEDDHRSSRADQAYDRWFAHDPAALQLKLDHLSDALVALNDGRGPDILALAEVEDVRAAELLRDALNRKLEDSSLHYTNVLMKELKNAGRHIAPAILTRLPVWHDKTRLRGSRLRILEGHVEVNGRELVILASHWTSRVSDEEGGRRDKYADQLYGTFRGMYHNNPAVDLLICGDFNDPPDDESVTQHLHAIGDREAVLAAHDEPLLLDLMADKDPREFGTHYHARKWYIFDQIVVSPGLLDDEGWTVEPDSVRVVNTLVKPNDHQHRPWAFGNERERAPRGYSDHFPVTVELRVD